MCVFHVFHVTYMLTIQRLNRTSEIKMLHRALTHVIITAPWGGGETPPASSWGIPPPRGGKEPGVLTITGLGVIYQLCHLERKSDWDPSGLSHQCWCPQGKV